MKKYCKPVVHTEAEILDNALLAGSNGDQSKNGLPISDTEVDGQGAKANTNVSWTDDDQDMKKDEY